jgi:hypothetical protein
VISAANEGDVWRTLETLLEAIASAYPTSLEDDEERLRLARARLGGGDACQGAGTEGGEQEEGRQGCSTEEGEDRISAGMVACLAHVVSQKRIVRENMGRVRAQLEALALPPLS